MNLIDELRKRNVFRTMAAYLVGAWVMVQVVGFVSDAAEMPVWTDTLVLILVLMGLPIVFVASWALELTPEGVKRTHSIEEIEAKPFGAFDIVLSVAVVAVVGLFAWQTFTGPSEVTRAERNTQQGVEAEPIATSAANSIAVMPFIAISEEDADRVLGDGLAEELLSVLAQFPDLRVAGRTSSFAFRDEAEDIPAIGAALNVSHVLEGSVRRLGEQVRVTAQLIRVADGFHIWSGTYDRPFEDIIEVQDDIVRQIAQVLTIRLGVGGTALTARRTANAAAYEQYLRGRVLFAERHLEGNRAGAMTAFQTATDIDPEFADAWAALARSIVYSDLIVDGRERYDQTVAAAERALALDPNTVEALIALSQVSLQDTRDWAASGDYIERALALAPNAAFVHYQAAFHHQYMGDHARMASAFRRAIALDPLNVTIRTNALTTYIESGLLIQAEQLLNAGTFPETVRADAVRSIGVFRRDVEAIREGFEAGRIAYGDEGLNAPVFESLVLAWAEGDRARVLELMPETLVEVEGLGALTPFFIQIIYLLAEEYRVAAEMIAAIDQPLLLDDAVYLSMQEIDVGYACQPAYHEAWQRPGIAELMEIRRANGATANLPLDGPECEPYLTD